MFGINKLKKRIAELEAAVIQKDREISSLRLKVMLQKNEVSGIMALALEHAPLKKGHKLGDGNKVISDISIKPVQKNMNWLDKLGNKTQKMYRIRRIWAYTEVLVTEVAKTLFVPKEYSYHYTIMNINTGDSETLSGNELKEIYGI